MRTLRRRLPLVRTSTFDGWHVTGDLRPLHDRSVATKAGATVRWRF